MLGNNGRRTSHMRRAEALSLWYDLTLYRVRDDAPDLTARQMAVLLTLYLKDGPHTVRSLADHLAVQSCVISRALTSLSGYGFIKRLKNPDDKRSMLIARTASGSRYLSHMAEKMRELGNIYLGAATPPADHAYKEMVSVQAAKAAKANHEVA